MLGFKAADKASLDVVSVYGGNRWIQLRKVRLIAALPAILSALQVAVPTAFLGAVLGEYMGATNRSVGIMMIRFQGTRACSSAGWTSPCPCAMRSAWPPPPTSTARCTPACRRPVAMPSLR